MQQSTRSNLGPRVLRLWWLIGAVVVMAVVAGVNASLQTETTYTGRSSLIVNSNNRAPEQDGVLVQGYVDYFNDAAYQRQVAEQAGVTEPVSLGARAAAGSPILIVQATARSAEVARDAASDVARTFQDDINQTIDDNQAEQLEGLRQQLAAAVASGGQDSASASAIQNAITNVETDRTNKLQELQLDGGVATNRPSLVNDAAVAGVGGLVLGLLIATPLAALGQRRQRRRAERQ